MAHEASGYLPTSMEVTRRDFGVVLASATVLAALSACGGGSSGSDGGGGGTSVPPPVSEGATEHGRTFVRASVPTDTSIPQDAAMLVMRAATEFLKPALEKEGPSREALFAVLKHVDRPFSAAAIDAVQLRDDVPVIEGEGITAESTLVASTLYIRAIRELSDSSNAGQIFQLLRDPANSMAELRKVLESLEPDFNDGLLIAAAEVHEKDQAYRALITEAAGQLESLQQDMHNLAMSGEGREGSWEIGVTVGCVLTAWWCAVAAVLIMVTLGGIIVHSTVSRGK